MVDFGTPGDQRLDDSGAAELGGQRQGSHAAWVRRAVDVGAAIEEMLRCYAANTFPRWVAHDSAFFGAPLRRGDMVLVSLPTANLDPRGFANPTTVDMERKTPHLVFGAGVHRCVGAQLARIEIRTLLSLWLRDMPPFRLDPDRPWKYHTGFVFSVDSLPIRWD